MTTLAFDTHAFVKRLHEVGFTDEQAERLAELSQEIVNATLEQIHQRELASKQDLKETELRLELKIAETKSDLIRWIVGAGLLQTALITALLLKLSSGI
ncbi:MULTISPECIES: coiled-coil domain-containing protein [Methylomonas]|uniref:DUF1640 domain-containing protein n=1 Tax=Methylomonas koyamae TaxID=702114 RepID=A0A177PGQ1_9GAMM|nr:MULTISPECIES: coiled-coil domain-containing protein [Methylomonas]ANE54268.1 hypothetical protein AYM39_03080 [Methylomonas sp. DH-1]ATG88932.1 hypothetical protein MKLM6_0657 [Methylomonas koyamae]OAI14804.1 hypothetical protein A1507_00960 [Methylomonas koyamae]OAI28540.1 hypothetical protein A1356_06675 [Methylomonas koyamae]WNB76586.1 DUF1640 domain-containing protein [Methylomonas koyamae]